MLPAADSRAVLPEGPAVTEDGVRFVLNDHPDWQPVSVWFHLRDFGADPAFRKEGDQWVARIPRPPVDRMEYLISSRSGASEWMHTDPANPLLAHGVFGDHSVIEFGEYVRPEWLGASAPEGYWEPLHLTDELAQIELTGDLWCPAYSEARTPLPLLVVHDGPEYADLARLLDYLGWLWRSEPDLTARVLLLKPVDRDRSYSASPGYARSLMVRGIPSVRDSFETTGPLVGIGASLGGLSLMHAATRYPGVFGGLFLQSGSFFVPRYDSHEWRFRFYDRVVAFVEDIGADPEALAGLRVQMTCGTGEENLFNNRRFAAGLRRLGVPVEMFENADGHNYPGWRDCLHPHLAELLRRVWRTGNEGL